MFFLFNQCFKQVETQKKNYISACKSIENVTDKRPCIFLSDTLTQSL